jgi:thiol-disulfide isomerase/thioredoxin
MQRLERGDWMSTFRGYVIGGILAGLLGASCPSALAVEPSKAIDFKFTSLEGKGLQLSSFRGKWVLVNFWAPWCPLCWPEVPALNGLNQRNDMVVIGVGMDYGPDEASVNNAIRNKNMRYHAQVLGGSRRDPASPFRQVGPVDFYPTSYLYDPNGEIVMFIPGQMKPQQLIAFMERRRASDTSIAAPADTRRKVVKERVASNP